MIGRGIAVLSSTLVVLLLSAPPGVAISPPEVDAQAVPPPGTPGPPQPMTQRGECVSTGVLPGSDPAAINPNMVALNLAEAWQHSRGEGQTVAIIDTGVQRGPRLPNVEAGGDFVASSDGLIDCDGHGTLVAGLIAGQPGNDGFSGVAPSARLISIRQTSAKYSPQTPGDDPAVSRAAADVASLARAVVRAADLGARVINISAVTCLPANKTIDQTELGAALKYAAVQKDAVIVAASGNQRGGMSTGSACDSNPLSDPARPDDPRNWAGVTAVSIPSWWQPYVLSVGSLAPSGQPSDFTMAGPWLGIAAPGENIVSVTNGPGGGLANGLPDDEQEMFGINGTSYAAAYVSGVAALVRSKFPELRADEVVRRITATANAAARSPSNLVGAGSVDPVAALTWDIPPDAQDAAVVRPVAAPPPPPPVDSTPRTVAFVGAGVLALAVLATAALSAHRRKDKVS
ncbi:MAG TPA: type VII secretion-associated serine protease mycosin [Mycobacterium sp.]|nr:type VII secretion-associated serine protease mycosin [Mycobacterium sp.]